MNGPKPGNTGNDNTPTDREHVEDVLDEALDETFPASDPPAITEPKRAPPPHDAD